MTLDDRVNWFPHPWPDGKHVVFVAYANGVKGHPRDKHVELRLMSAKAGPTKTLLELFVGRERCMCLVGRPLETALPLCAISPDKRRLTSRFLNGIQRHALRTLCCEAILKSGESVPSGKGGGL
jgi:hypothetical protein